MEMKRESLAFQTCVRKSLNQTTPETALIPLPSRSPFTDIGTELGLGLSASAVKCSENANLNFLSLFCGSNPSSGLPLRLFVPDLSFLLAA
jgi:hypothetical protein